EVGSSCPKPARKPSAHLIGSPAMATEAVLATRTSAPLRPPPSSPALSFRASCYWSRTIHTCAPRSDSFFVVWAFPSWRRRTAPRRCELAGRIGGEIALRPLSICRSTRRRFLRQRKADPKEGPLPRLRLDVERRVVVLQNDCHERQPQAHAGTDSFIDCVVALGREMGFGAALAHLLRHADAVILDVQHRPVAVPAGAQDDRAPPG